MKKLVMILLLRIGHVSLLVHIFLEAFVEKPSKLFGLVEYLEPLDNSKRRNMRCSHFEVRDFGQYHHIIAANFYI